MPNGGGDLWIANTISDLIQGDIHEHLPLASISLVGDVLGLGTTTSIDNGELAFLRNPAGDTTIWKCQASDGGIRALRGIDRSDHFPYVCYTDNAEDLKVSVEAADLRAVAGLPLQEQVQLLIHRLQQRGHLDPAPIIGLRAELEWTSLVITVASKLCMGQQRRNAAVARSGSDTQSSRPIYELLQHYRLAAIDPADPADPIRYLGSSLLWDCCGFYDTEPETGRVTVPQAGAHLHLHGCSLDLRYGGHLHHEHPGSVLCALRRLSLYPLQRLHHIASDLAITHLSIEDSSLQFMVRNLGALDVSDVGVAVVLNNCYSTHRYLRLPWLAAGAQELFAVPLELPSGTHRIDVIADPERRVLEEAGMEANNRASLELTVCAGSPCSHQVPGPGQHGAEAAKGD